MGFRTGNFARIWEVKPISNTQTRMRISISRRDKQTGEFVQDFSGYVTAVGTSAAAKASKLKNGDRIKLIDIDVSNNYDKVKKVEYTNFKVFNFEIADDASSSNPTTRVQARSRTVDDGNVDDNDLPY